MNEDIKPTSLPAGATYDFCGLKYIEIVPLTRYTDGPYATDCDSGDWSAHFKPENLAVVKQEPDDVCCAGLHIFEEVYYCYTGRNPVRLQAHGHSP